MIGIFRKIGLAAIVSMMAFGGAVSTASADSLGWGVYVGGGGYGVEVRDGYRDGYRDGHRGGWREDRRDDRRHGWGRPDRRSECRPQHAMEKARWNGMRRTFVADVTPRRVVIAGIRHGGRDRMVFANVRGCPVIRY